MANISNNWYNMIVEETYLKGCFVLTPQVFEDKRGFFFESFNERKFEAETGIIAKYVQDNQSKSSSGVLRGMHFQTGEYAQAKLIQVIKGKVFDVCIDIRKESPTFGKSFSIVLDDVKHKQVYIPRGFAHGFLVLEDDTIFSYKCDNYYSQAHEAGILYSDPQLEIDWNFPLENIILSPKDQQLPTLESMFK